MVPELAYRLVGKLRASSRKHDFTWHYTFNLAATLAYKLRRDRLSGESARVLEELDRWGLAVSSVDRLLGQGSCYEELRATVHASEQALEKQIAEAREAADGPGAIGKKTYMFMLLGPRPALDLESVYGRFALQEPVREIANAYFGMCTSLRYFNVWHTVPTLAAARESQLWHRDPEDRQILKVFVNLSDVDDGAGPLTYAAGTHVKGTVRGEPRYIVEADGSRRSDDSQMAEVVPSEQWVRGVGPSGTMIFADTRGYHKGGLARERDRILYVCQFTSPSSG